MEVHGYKSFNSDMTNRYGLPFEEGKIYDTEGELKFGIDGNGFHFCERLEDTLKFFDGEVERKVAAVTSLGEVLKRDDEQQDFYDMYVARRLRIDKVLTRKEILEYILSTDIDYRVIRFVMFFKLTEEEIDYFIARYNNNMRIVKAILYYQKGMKDIYNKSDIEYSLILGKKG